MVNDPIFRVRDGLREIEVLHDIEKRYDLEGLAASSIARRATAYAIQTISETIRYYPR